jgi:hypothetical protein
VGQVPLHARNRRIYPMQIVALMRALAGHRNFMIKLRIAPKHKWVLRIRTQTLLFLEDLRNHAPIFATPGPIQGDGGKPTRPTP